MKMAKGHFPLEIRRVTAIHASENENHKKKGILSGMGVTNQTIDIHTHAFPDALAERAIPALEREAIEAGSEVRAFTNGKVSGLLSSMDQAGIDRSVICSIATRPDQFESILTWSKEVQTDRIIAFASLHPDDPDPVERVRKIAGEGFKGVKFHPYYQDFYLAEERMWPVYEALSETGLVVMMHTGFDIAFPRIRRCDPAQVVEVVERFPALKLVSTHLGAWMQWEEVKEMILGKPIYMELSFAVEYLGESMREFLETHPRDYLLFGSDSPWTGQKETLDTVRGLGLDDNLMDALLGGNAARLLNL